VAWPGKETAAARSLDLGATEEEEVTGGQNRVRRRVCTVPRR
jgi:hypothetical protein